MKIAILDAHTTNPGDLSWDPIAAYGRLAVYDYTLPAEIVSHTGDAEIIVANAVPFDRDAFAALPNLKFLDVMSTGYNHIDLKAAKEFGVAVANVPGYSTDAVAQHTIALLLALTNKVALHNESVQRGDYFDAQDDCYFLSPLTLLAGKTFGIIGYGNIGKKAGAIAAAFGMEVIPYSKDPKRAQRADVVSLHCPLTPENRQIINESFIANMKTGAILINTARGGLVDEKALADALESGKLSGAGVDTLTVEPPKRENPSPLMGLGNCVITPHNAWMPVETRELLIQITADNIGSFLAGGRLNRVDQE